MAVLLVADPVHWTHVDCTVGEVRKAFRLLHWGLMPARLRYMALPSRWTRFGLNYVRTNLKAKCFSDGVGRVCTKPGHSCLRKVVSWRSHPAVDYYRWLARAVQTLVKSWGRAYEVTSLKTAAAELRRKVAALEGTEDGRCERCGLPELLQHPMRFQPLPARPVHHRLERLHLPRMRQPALPARSAARGQLLGPHQQLHVQRLQQRRVRARLLPQRCLLRGSGRVHVPQMR